MSVVDSPSPTPRTSFVRSSSKVPIAAESDSDSRSVAKAAKASEGELLVRDLPGHGCVFTLDLPRKPPPPLAIVDGGKRESVSAAAGEAKEQGTRTPKASR